MSNAAVAFVVAFGLLGPFVLYLLVRAEHGSRETMARDDAERVARRDIDDERKNR